MPMITKTVSTGHYPGVVWNTTNTGGKNNVRNMAEALAESIGLTESDVLVITDPNDSGKISCYVPMASIGYRGWCVCFETYVDSSERPYHIKGGICLFDDDGNTPDNNDQNKIVYDFIGGGDIIYRGEAGGSDGGGSTWPETCVRISDMYANTVMFDIHHGRTERASDLEYNDSGSFTVKFVIFFGRDVNGDVLCGIGNNVIAYIRTIERSMYDKSLLSVNLQLAESLKNGLHLTKMVNYLSPGYPEMKSAYISVTRPLADVSTNKRVCVYNVNGTNYGSAGDTDVWLTTYSSQPYRPVHGMYFPIHPLVKY